MYRILASLALAGGLAFTPTIAGATDTQLTDTPLTDTHTSDRTTDRAPRDVVERDTADRDSDRTRDRRFACTVHRSDRGPVVGCRWTAVREDRAAGYRLWRSVDGAAREVIFETRNNREHGYRDLVRPGHRYRYAVQYIAADGTVLHTSHVEYVSIPGDDRA